MAASSLAFFSISEETFMKSKLAKILAIASVAAGMPLAAFAQAADYPN